MFRFLRSLFKSMPSNADSSSHSSASSARKTPFQPTADDVKKAIEYSVVTTHYWIQLVRKDQKALIPEKYRARVSNLSLAISVNEQKTIDTFFKVTVDDLIPDYLSDRADGAVILPYGKPTVRCPYIPRMTISAQPPTVD